MNLLGIEILLFNFSFTKHYFDLGYKPYDFDLWKEWGHPCTDVHNLFAHKLYEIFEGQKYNV